MQNNLYLFVWDCYGLETCLNITEMEQTHLLNVLKDDVVGKLNPINSVLSAIILRARYNTQRHYEIYTCLVEPNIDRNDLVRMFMENPQQAADSIRNLGSELYSDRLDKAKVAIV